MDLDHCACVLLLALLMTLLTLVSAGIVLWCWWHGQKVHEDRAFLGSGYSRRKTSSAFATEIEELTARTSASTLRQTPSRKTSYAGIVGGSSSKGRSTPLTS